MSMNEQRPTSSQPTSSCSVLSATTSVSIDAVNRLSIGVVVGVADVALHVRGRVDVHEQRDRA